MKEEELMSEVDLELANEIFDTISEAITLERKRLAKKVRSRSSFCESASERHFLLDLANWIEKGCPNSYA